MRGIIQYIDEIHPPQFLLFFQKTIFNERNLRAFEG